MPQSPKILNDFSSLMQIVKDLRGPDGCPWDKEQTHESLTPFAIEEVHELVEAIESKDDAHTKEELGDVLFQVALHSQLAEERGAFTINEVIETLCSKLIRRHPHVFTDKKTTNIDEVWKNWEQIKTAEKKDKKVTTSIFDIPPSIPSLQRAYKIGLKSQKIGFDWKTAQEVFLKVQEELEELQVEIDLHTKDQNSFNKMEEEFGDLLFSLSQWARHMNIEPEQALRKANKKFINRFDKVQELCQSKEWNWEKLSDKQKEQLWSEVKTIENQKNKD
ncbi:MAG: nucleoside triphosphate pyrophosphohydrolase [Bdellovibrionaceae bacterium]|nr:nucleoside triphosphate pyrophosphohydrolase [Pseudobdellovibrionaceae bacterium]NUM59998.1 nucleoside triphosphate pyrophosphohydrolase [Pseudobdellovibrionaceae bacterium]